MQAISRLPVLLPLRLPWHLFRWPDQLLAASPFATELCWYRNALEMLCLLLILSRSLFPLYYLAVCHYRDKVLSESCLIQACGASLFSQRPGCSQSDQLRNWSTVSIARRGGFYLFLISISSTSLPLLITLFSFFIHLLPLLRGSDHILFSSLMILLADMLSD